MASHWDDFFADFDVRFTADASGYARAAEDVERANERINRSQQRAQQTQRAASRVAAQQVPANVLSSQQALQQYFNQSALPGPVPWWVRRGYSTPYPPSASGPVVPPGFTPPGPGPLHRFFRQQGRFAGPRSVVALPSAPGAIGGLAGGRTLGALADLGVVGGLLPETLGAGATGAAVGLLGAGIAINALTRASSAASRSLGTVASIRLDQSLATLRRETRLLFGEIGNALLPVVRLFVRGLTSAVRGLRNFLDWLGYGIEESAGGRATVAFTRDPVTGEIGGYTREPDATTIGGSPSRSIQGAEQRGDYSYPQAAEDRFGFLTPFEGAPGTGGFQTTPADRSDVFTGPSFQHGGIVRPRPGGVLARVAEAGEAEAILPMRVLSQAMGGMTQQSTESAKYIADAFQSALEQSQELPPLWERHRELDQAFAGGDVVTNTTIAGAAATPVTWLTQAAYDALTTEQTAGVFVTFSTA